MQVEGTVNAKVLGWSGVLDEPKEGLQRVTGRAVGWGL